MRNYISIRASVAAGALAVAMLASNAQAQQVSDPGTTQTDSGEGAGEILVTGTRIARPDLASNSPLTSVSDAEIRYQGVVNAETLLARLPQFTPDANENVSNGSDGSAQINLRNLGSNRVLTLINGHRILSSQATDINFVPVALLERVDVVTGGASAVYGSDAMSGVVNFVLRDHLDGFRLDAQTSFAQHNNDNAYVRGLVSAKGYQLAPRNVIDGAKQDVNGAFGKTFADGRAKIMVYGGYRHTDPVQQSSRDYSSCALNAASETDLVCGGSSNTTFGTFAPLTGPSAGLGYLTNARDGSKSWVPYDASYAYNYSPTNYIQRSDERYTGGGIGSFEIAPVATVYGSFMWMKDHTFSQVAPSALFLGTTFTIPCNNPLMSSAQATALCGTAAGTSATADTLIGYRLDGTYSRRDDLRHQDYRYNAGVKGDIGRGFNYDVSYLYALSRFDETYLNNVDNVKAQRALDVVSVGGTPTCRSKVDGTDPACVPIDIFKANGITAAQAEYLFSPSNTASRNTLEVVSGTVSGDLGTAFGIHSPWATRGAGIALGVEHRRETLNYTVDAVAAQGGAANADGVISVNEAYGELELPLVADVPFLHELTVNGGLRYSSYTNQQPSTSTKSSYKAWTYKAELAWSPVAGARFRASYNRAIRAPNISELFGARGIGNVALNDPCAGAAPTASLATCKLTGVTDAQYGNIIQCPADTCSQSYGGNPALKPEVGDTYTFGVVLTPKQVPGLSLSLDYYHIKVNGYIGSIGPSLVVSQCTTTGDPYYCGLFRRDPRTGALFGSNGYVVGSTLNTGYLLTSGIDIAASYATRIGALGKLDASIVGTWQEQQTVEPLPNLGTYDCKGYYGYSCGQPNPEWRHFARLTWIVPGEKATLSLAWRHFASTRLSSLSSNPFLAGTPSVINATIPTYDYFDLATTVSVARQLQFRAGINNLTDKAPPAIASGVLASFGNGNTYPGVYDPMGRTVFFGATLSF
ncbi:TonB-dependent receptor domain-containing protein [Sphingomonas sp. HT-1]|uniref:TonB-dependent receptor domain-containing protein n=1 Tax=unclassified Sphingomonas TaxID=196159 RepID=UPI000A8C2AB3|nr:MULTISPECIES: TonB-dependent receptor [unclassified Sphingomonas]